MNTNTICSPTPRNLQAKTPFERKLLKISAKADSRCLKYEKCSKAKCNFPDIELKNELMKEAMDDPSKVMNIVQKCLDSNDKISCTHDEYVKIFPKLKTLSEQVKKCKKETCKKESDSMIALGEKLQKQVKLKQIIDKFANMISKTKNNKGHGNSKRKSKKSMPNTLLTNTQVLGNMTNNK
jgi:hypothetical protein